MNDQIKYSEEYRIRFKDKNKVFINYQKSTGTNDRIEHSGIVIVMNNIRHTFIIEINRYERSEQNILKNIELE